MIARARDSITENSWRYAVPAGAAAGVSVVLEADLAAKSVSFDLSPVVLASLIGGALLVGESSKASTIGFRTGLVGSLPALIHILSVYTAIPSFDQPMWAGGVQVVFALILVVIVAGFSGGVGAFGSKIGYWLSGKLGTRRRPAATG